MAESKVIDIKEFSKNAKKLVTKDTVLYLREGKSILYQVKPLSENQRHKQELIDTVRRSREDVKAGRVHSTEEVLKLLEIK